MGARHKAENLMAENKKKTKNHMAESMQMEQNN